MSAVELTEAVQQTRTALAGGDRAKISGVAIVPAAKHVKGTPPVDLKVRRLVTKHASVVGLTIDAGNTVLTVWVHSKALRMALETVGAAPMSDYDDRDIELVLLRDEVAELWSVLAGIHQASGGVA